MIKLDKMKTYFFAGMGKIFPLGQALPIQMSIEAVQSCCQISRKEAHVY